MPGFRRDFEFFLSRYELVQPSHSTSLSHDDGLLDDEEFLLLYDQFPSRNPDFPYDTYPNFDLDELDESECLAEFRVRKRDIIALSDVLQIPAIIECDQQSICDGNEDLCILLRRLSSGILGL